jgi:RNA recognition motif-containing protein
MNLFVAKLSPSTTSDDLQKIFSAYGEVTSAKIIFDKETGNSKGYGFVEMENEEEAKAAIAALNGSDQEGNTIVVKEANAPEDRPKRDAGNRGGFRGGFQGRSNSGGGFQRRTDNRGGGGGGYQRRDDNRGGGGGFQRRDDNRSGGSRNFGTRDNDGGNRW